MRRFFFLLQLAALTLLFCVFPRTGSASDFELWRNGLYQTVAWNDIATTATLASTGDIIVTDFSIASSATTSVPAASIKQPPQPRRLAGRIFENSGTGLVGTITVSGINVFDVNASDQVTTAGGTRYFVTSQTYKRIDSITLSLTGNAASDTLCIGVYDFGVPCMKSTGPDNVVEDGTSEVAGEWDNDYGAWKPSSALGTDAVLIFQWAEGTPSQPRRGRAPTITAQTDLSTWQPE